MASTSTNKLGKPLRDNIVKIRWRGRSDNNWDRLGGSRHRLYTPLFRRFYDVLIPALQRQVCPEKSL